MRRGEAGRSAGRRSQRKLICDMTKFNPPPSLLCRKKSCSISQLRARPDSAPRPLRPAQPGTPEPRTAPGRWGGTSQPRARLTGRETLPHILTAEPTRGKRRGCPRARSNSDGSPERRVAAGARPQRAPRHRPGGGTGGPKLCFHPKLRRCGG